MRTGLLLASTAVALVAAGRTGAAGPIDVNGVVTHTADHDYAEQIMVGNGTSGTMVVQDGADVRNTDAFVGASSASVSPNGEVVVTGPGSSWFSAGDVIIGHLSDGRLQLLDQGYAEVTGDVTIGGSAGAGTVIVDNSSVLATWGGNLYVGNGSYGALTLTNNSAANIDGGAGEIHVGSTSAAGAITIGTGGGTLLASVVRFDNIGSSLTLDHGLGSYNFNTDLSGNGQLIVESGTTSLYGDAAAFTGETHINGGALLLEGVDLGSAVDVDGGLLGGRGSVTGAISVRSGSTLAPGSASATGQFSSNDDVTFYSGSTFEVHVDNAGNGDRLGSGSSIYLDNGVTLNVLAQNGRDDGST
jgi:T5SS/PEP-CTERM-associated repeat protein/autotransporter-associated beta strand protein